MKRIFFTVLFYIGFFAGAEGLQSLASPSDAAPHTDTSVFQMSQMEVVKAKRNGFVASDFGIVYVPKADSFIFTIETSYGEVIGKSDIAPAGTFEGMASVKGAFSAGVSNIVISATTEINFIKNDGMNKLVPGLDISVSLGYVDTPSSEGYLSSIGGGVYLKAFISKQFALVPHLGIAYGQGGNSDIIVGTGVILSGGVGLRRYF